MNRLLLLLAVLGFVAGCSSVRVHTDHAEDADFRRFRTFQYQHSSNTVAAASPLTHERIVAGLRRHMILAGFVEAESGADVVVTYHGSTDQQVEFRTTYTGGGSSWGSSQWGGRGSSRHVGLGMSSSTTRPNTITQGTLVIDIWEVASNRLLWRSTVTGTLNPNPERNTANINEGIERAFRRFPPN
jgi:uncharacterized protein YceK